MDPRFSPFQLAHVPVYYWPWIWWQLFWLRVWCEASGRQVLYEITPEGHVDVFMISDDKNDLRSWQARYAAARKPHLEMCDNADGALNASAIAVYIGKAFERFGCYIIYVAAHCQPRPAPELRDSS